MRTEATPPALRAKGSIRLGRDWLRVTDPKRVWSVTAIEGRIWVTSFDGDRSIRVNRSEMVADETLLVLTYQNVQRFLSLRGFVLRRVRRWGGNNVDVRYEFYRKGRKNSETERQKPADFANSLEHVVVKVLLPH